MLCATTFVKMLLLLVFVVSVASGTVCPGFCPATCINEVVDCPQNYSVVPGGSACGCCPGCVKFLQENDECGTENTTLACAPGLKCVASKCVKGPCLKKTDCISWTSRCLSNGDFAPVQCKGDKPTGRCYCVSPNGERIFGEQWWVDADNMTCACSRKMWELLQTGRKDVTLHCTQEGNFEELQCDQDLCWCADEMTGEPMSIVVPDFMIQTLPCYNASVIGISYLRKCESQKFAQARIAMEMEAHGTLNVALSETNCDWDGSFGAVQKMDATTIRCKWKDYSDFVKLWAAEISNRDQMNCNCARDTKWYDLADREFVLSCSNMGNYDPVQQVGGVRFCVDSDGFRCSEAGATPVCQECCIESKDE